MSSHSREQVESSLSPLYDQIALAVDPEAAEKYWCGYGYILKFAGREKRFTHEGFDGDVYVELNNGELFIKFTLGRDAAPELKRQLRDHCLRPVCERSPRFSEADGWENAGRTGEFMSIRKFRGFSALPPIECAARISEAFELCEILARAADQCSGRASPAIASDKVHWIKGNS